MFKRQQSTTSSKPAEHPMKAPAEPLGMLRPSCDKFNFGKRIYSFLVRTCSQYLSPRQPRRRRRTWRWKGSRAVKYTVTIFISCQTNKVHAVSDVYHFSFSSLCRCYASSSGHRAESASRSKDRFQSWSSIPFHYEFLSKAETYF